MPGGLALSVLSRRSLTGEAALALLIVVSAAACRQSADARAAHEPDASSVGVVRFYRNPAKVPDFTLRDLDGRTLKSSEWRGKVVFVNFWATWCGPCRAEIPSLIALQEKYRKELLIVGISEDEGDPADVKRFATAQRMNYPIVMLTPDTERLFPGVGAIPTTFVLDREGRVVQKHVGLYSAELLEAETRSLAGLAINARVEEVDRAQPAKLENAAQATNIPGVDLSKLPPSRRAEALQKLNSEGCTCGCDFTLAKCRIDDPGCGISLPRARQIVNAIAEER